MGTSSSEAINLIKNIQKRATRLVNGIGDLDYSQRLALLKLPTLAHRRRRGDMIEIWKHFNFYQRNTLSKSFKPRDRPSRKHPYQLMHNRSLDGERGIQRNSFYHRVTEVWNNLPESVVNNQTMNGFKNALDKYWRSVSDH